MLHTHARRGYVMLVALILLAIITVIGATSLNLAGVDERIAQHNKKHMIVLNTAMAGTDHARNRLQSYSPNEESLDSGSSGSPDSDTSTTLFVNLPTAETKFEGLDFDQNLGVYWVEAVYQKCGNPPPGYSTEDGAGFRSDYWGMRSTGQMLDTSYDEVNQSEAIAIATVRKVMQGECKIR